MKEEGAESVADLVELSDLAEFCSGVGMNAVQRNKLSKALAGRGGSGGAAPVKQSEAGPTTVISNAPGRWDVFLSHTQRDPAAVVLASEMYYELKERGLAVWLDVKMKVLHSTPH